MTAKVTRILVVALGGEGGGVLMNWIVSAAQAAGHVVQATSVPGVAQRTGSTSYYIEIAPKDAPTSLLGLVPVAGRVDVIVSSELIETARVLEAGFVSPDRTTVISSTARFFSTAEKIQLGDGRYAEENIVSATQQMAKASHLLDLGELAKTNGTFVSATMFGALTGSRVLPWPSDVSRDVLTDDRSRAGFDAASAAIVNGTATAQKVEPLRDPPSTPGTATDQLPESLRKVITLGSERMVDYQDAAYQTLFHERLDRILSSADLSEHRSEHAATEAIRRLALWMAYEDVARVADLKTRPERFERIRGELGLKPGQIFSVTEYMKPRAEEIADILPALIGRRVMARTARGGWFPFLGKGRYIRSNGVFGFWMLRLVASTRHMRRKSLRFAEEQHAIEDWLDCLTIAMSRSPDFALALGELPRVLKGYSDTLMRGKRAYDEIFDKVVRPALDNGTEAQDAKRLRDAIGAALADDRHEALDALLSGAPKADPVPILRRAVNA